MPNVLLSANQPNLTDAREREKGISKVLGEFKGDGGQNNRQFLSSQRVSKAIQYVRKYNTHDPIETEMIECVMN